MSVKLKRLGELKNETQKVYDKMRLERIKEINKMELKDAKVIKNATTFLPYDDDKVAGPRKRSRGLTYFENEELKKYQEKSGIPVYQKKKEQTGYPELNKPLGDPIGKPTNTPVFPLPGQPSNGYPNLNPNYSRPPGYTNNNIPPPMPPPAGYPAPNLTPKPAQPQPQTTKSKGGTLLSMKKWFGVSK